MAGSCIRLEPVFAYHAIIVRRATDARAYSPSDVDGTLYAAICRYDRSPWVICVLQL